MCKFHKSDFTVNRRTFLAAGAALSGTSLVYHAAFGQTSNATAPSIPARPKTPARVMAAFLYPHDEVVNEGRLEDPWAAHRWFTWPGNQFRPEEQERKFTEKISEIARRLGVEMDIQPGGIWQQARGEAFIEQVRSARPDALLVINFWNGLSALSYRLATESQVPAAIVYHTLGANHQLPPENLRKTEGLFYIHSMENWDEIERGLIAVQARKMLSQSRLLRISSQPDPEAWNEPAFGVEVVSAAAEEFNALFDAIPDDDALVGEAMAFKASAGRVSDVADREFIDAVRADHAVRRIMERYGADAVTIECLQLKHRKPCYSFARHNGALVPCGCENDLDASLTLMLGRWLLGRGGFQHNPEFDTSENLYFASHCTCPWKLHGPDGPPSSFFVRPFFHQLPKTPAVDVQWAPGEPVTLLKYVGAQGTLACWTGRVIASPECPPTGGCSTRVLMEIDRCEDVCEVYAGPHPVLFCAGRSEARRFKAFARMYRLKLQGNV